VTARKAPLRAVADGEKPTPRRPRAKNVVTAAATGSRLELLVSLRARIAKDVADPNTHPRDLAALSRRLTEIAKEIEAMETEYSEGEVATAADTADSGWRAEAL
jgi:hypothetical protein